MLLVQRRFWVGTTDDPEATDADAHPGQPVRVGLLALGVSLVMLVVAS